MCQIRRLLTLLVIMINSADVHALRYERLGMQAPEAPLLTLDSRQVSSTDLLGNTGTLIIFWALWSPRSCRQLLDMTEVYDTLQAHGVEVLGVSVDKQEFTAELIDSIRQYTSAQAIPFPVCIDPGLKLFNAYGVIAVPTTFVLSPDARILYTLSSYSPFAADTLLETARSLLGIAGESSVQILPVYQPKGNAARFFNIGRKLWHVGDLTSAAQYMNRAITEDSSYAEAHYECGMLAMERMLPDSAITAFRHASEADPSNSKYRTAWAKAALRHEDTTYAIQLAREAIQIDSTYPDSYALLAEINLARNEPVQAEVHLREGRANARNSISLTLAECALLLHTGDTSGALRVVRTAVSKQLEQR